MRYSRCCLLSSRNSSLFKAVELDDWDEREQLRHAMLDAMLLGTRFSSCSVQVPTNTRRSYEMFSGGCATENLLNVGRRRCSSSASLFHSNNHRCASFSRGIFSYLSFLFCFSPVSFFGIFSPLDAFTKRTSPKRNSEAEASGLIGKADCHEMGSS